MMARESARGDERANRHRRHRVPVPGKADAPDGFWRLLRDGVDAVTTVPPDRWSVRDFYDPEPGTPGKTNSCWGGFIGGIDEFDAAFFAISPREAARMDPQQRLLLEVSWEALEDGGIAAEHVAGSNTGVFVGISSQDYMVIQQTTADLTMTDAHTNTGGALSIAANRLSYALDLRGPSLAVDTACSSSLVAVHLACHSLWRRECSIWPWRVGSISSSSRSRSWGSAACPCCLPTVAARRFTPAPMVMSAAKAPAWSC